MKVIQLRKVLALILCMTMCLSLVPAAWATDLYDDPGYEDFDYQDPFQTEAEPTPVFFQIEPAQAYVTVYDIWQSDEFGNPVVFLPDEYGTYWLLPGEYAVGVVCEGYESVLETVYVDYEPLTIPVLLTPIDNRVADVFTSEETVPDITVYSLAEADEFGEPAIVAPEEDGFYLLAPGEYLYDAAAESYEPLKGEPFTVDEADIPLTIPVVLQASSEGASEENAADAVEGGDDALAGDDTDPTVEGGDDALAGDDTDTADEGGDDALTGDDTDTAVEGDNDALVNDNANPITEDDGDNILYANGYTGLQYDEGIGWRYYTNGVFDSSYTGLASRADIGWWYVENGIITFTYTGLTYTEGSGWWYVTNSQLQWNYTGPAYREDIGWVYCEDSQVTFAYNGLGFREDIGWWYFENSQLTFSYTGLTYTEGSGWWYVTNSQLQWNYTGPAYREDIGWWYCENSQITFTYNGLGYREDIGWWYFENSQLRWNYTGPAYREDIGWWYCENSQITYTYTGTCVIDGNTFNVVNSQVIMSEIVYQDIDSNTVRVAAYYGSKSELTIPETYYGKTVVEIGPSAFENHSELISIDLPDTITVIGARAFAGCSSLSTMS